MGILLRPGVIPTAVAVLTLALSGCIHERFTGDGAVQASDFASGERFTSLRIEIDYVDGVAPHPDATALLRTRAAERLDKPDGIQITSNSFSGGRATWSISSIKDAQDQVRDHLPEGSELTLHVLYLDGVYGPNEDVLGVQYERTAIAIFKERIQQSSAGVSLGFGAREVERSVLVHEFGHAIGLVNNGVPMVRQHEHDDPEKRGHSDNDASVMWPAIETTGIFAAFFETPPTNFDSDDIADLRAVGGK